MVQQLRDRHVDAAIVVPLDPAAPYWAAVRVALRVGDQRETLVTQQGPAELDDESLLPEVLQRAAEHADGAGAPERQRAGRRVDLVAKLVCRLSYPLQGLLRQVQPAQRIRHGSCRQPGRLGDIAHGGALGPKRHDVSEVHRPGTRRART